MTTFDERERGFEEKFHHDRELEFKINVHRNKLLGLWVADQLGLPDSEKEAYANSLVTLDYSMSGNAMVRKVLADCEARGVEMSEHRLRRHLEDSFVAARAEVLGTKP